MTVRRPAPGLGRILVGSDWTKGSSLFGIVRPESAADRPELHRQVRELAGDVHADPGGTLHLFPLTVRLIELEIRKSGVVRDLPRRDRYGADRNAWQLQPDQVANPFGRTDLQLRRESPPEFLRWEIGARGEDEHRIVEERPVVHHGDADPEP